MVDIELKKRPKNPTILQGFPGFGLVGTITTEFLLEHLETEQIGRVLLEETPAMVAIHENKLVEPLGIFYNKKHNLVIVHALNTPHGQEWRLADYIVSLVDELKAKEVISVEGVGSTESPDTSRTFYFANNAECIHKFKQLGVAPLKEGIIMGVTSALLLKLKNVPISCVFAETHTQLPDSKAAAKIIEILDGYLDLKVDPKPLLDTAKKFEDKLKKIITSGNQASQLRDAKQLSYLG
ncbi:MAG: PAC2 family protein [Candidatus Woesearchaeota archaeon]